MSVMAIYKYVWSRLLCVPSLLDTYRVAYCFLDSARQSQLTEYCMTLFSTDLHSVPAEYISKKTNVFVAFLLTNIAANSLFMVI